MKIPIPEFDRVIDIGFCVWKHQFETGIYDTGCGNAFEVTYDTPAKNGMIFCPYCGRKLKEAYEEPHHER